MMVVCRDTDDRMSEQEKLWSPYVIGEETFPEKGGGWLKVTQ